TPTSADLITTDGLNPSTISHTSISIPTLQPRAATYPIASAIKQTATAPTPASQASGAQTAVCVTNSSYNLLLTNLSDIFPGVNIAIYTPANGTKPLLPLSRSDGSFR